MVNELVVQKYGGTSVATLERIRKVAAHICTTVRNDSKVLVVVSAMGHHTDELLTMATGLNQAPPKRELDMLLSTGERVSMALLSIALHEAGINAISLTGSQSGILTDGNHGNALIDTIADARIRRELETHDVVIVAGFQGVCPQTKEITTLGRGGSDLSAIALAIALRAKACQIYTDVRGIMTSDPRVVPSAQFVPQIPWTAMAHLAWAGAGVLHHRGAHLAKKFQLPVEVRSSLDFTLTGTVIEGFDVMEKPVVHAITHKERQSLVRIKTPASISSHVGETLRWLWTNEEAPIFFRQNVENDEAVLETLVSSGIVASLLDFMQTRSKASFKVVPELASITVVGSGFKQNPQILAQVCAAVPQAHYLESQDTSITCCVPAYDLTNTLERLHATFFS